MYRRVQGTTTTFRSSRAASSTWSGATTRCWNTISAPACNAAARFTTCRSLRVMLPEICFRMTILPMCTADVGNGRSDRDRRLLLENHINMWSEHLGRVEAVAEKVRARGVEFDMTMDHSHVIMKMDNPPELRSGAGKRCPQRQHRARFPQAGHRNAETDPAESHRDRSRSSCHSEQSDKYLGQTSGRKLRQRCSISLDKARTRPVAFRMDR